MIKENSIIEIQGLTYRNSSGRMIFDNMSFFLGYGETAIIVGSVGKGKTSLVELILGYRAPQGGHIGVLGNIIYNGRKLNRRTIYENRKRIGGIGGVFQPISYQTVYENLRHPLILRGDNNVEQKEKILRSLTIANLLSKKGKKAEEISRGEKMILLMARATIANQPLLLIDEPLAGLDKETAFYMNDLIKKLAIAGHSILILTSDKSGLDIPAAISYTLVNGQLL